MTVVSQFIENGPDQLADYVASARRRAARAAMAGKRARTRHRSCCSRPARIAGTSAQHPDGMRDDAPDLERHTFDNLDVGIGRVLRVQPDPAPPTAETLQGELAIDQGDNDRAVDHGPRPVYDRDVTGKQTDAGHAT